MTDHCFDKTISYKMCDAWNPLPGLPVKLRTMSSLITFKKKLKNYFFKLAFYNYIPSIGSISTRDVEAEAEAGSGSGKFLWKRKLEAVNGYRFRFHLRCSIILTLNVFLTQNKQLKHTITRVCEASCCRKYPLLNSQKFESTAVC